MMKVIVRSYCDLKCGGHVLGNNSGGVDWLEDKSGGDVTKNKSYYTEGHGDFN
jgi:hypothetical protein